VTYGNAASVTRPAAHRRTDGERPLSLTEGVQAAHPNLNGNQLGYLPLLDAVTD
jgi:hypothetical protein